LNKSMEMFLDMGSSSLANTTISTASSLIGKSVEFSETNENGEKYKGIVKSVFLEDGIVNMEVKIDNTGEIKAFKYESLLKVSEKQ
jgi:flagellar basal-body rod modification protein FlgD